MTEISRIASEIASLIGFCERIESAECEARRQHNALGSTLAAAVRVCDPGEAYRMVVTVPRGVCPMVVLQNALKDADGRKDALESSALMVEPETIADALVLAAMAFAAFDPIASDSSPPEAELRRVAHLMGAVVRGLEKHCELTPDLNRLVDYYASTTRKPWTAIEAEAERVAGAVNAAGAGGAPPADGDTGAVRNSGAQHPHVRA